MPSQPSGTWLKVEAVGNATVARFHQPLLLTGEKAEAVGEELVRLADRLGQGRLVLNFANVQNLTSLMIGKLLAVQKKVHAAGGRFVLCAMSPDLREVFHVTHVDRVLSIFESEKEALEIP